jgi:hypothetical protein
VPLDNSLVSIKVWLLKNPFLADVDYSGALTSLRPIFKFNNYRNFSLFDRLKLRSKFKFKEFVKQRFEGHYVKAQINSDIWKDSNLLKHTLIFKSPSVFDRNNYNPNFNKEEFLPLLSEINEEESILEVLMILNQLLFIFFLDENVF